MSDKDVRVLVPMTRRQSSAVKKALDVYLNTEDNYGNFPSKDDRELVQKVLREVEQARKAVHWEKAY